MLVNFWVIIKILNFWAHQGGRNPVNLTSLLPNSNKEVLQIDHFCKINRLMALHQ